MSAYPSGGDPTAVLGRRSGAYIVDTLLASGIAVALFFATGDVTEIVDLRQCPSATPSGRGCATVNEYVYLFDLRAVAFAVLGWLVYAVVIMWFLQAATGATVGKAIFGLRTVNEAGTGPGFGRQTLRGLLWIFPDGFVNCFGVPLVAAISAGFSKGHRRVGDMAAKTYVVRSTARGRPILLPGAGAPAAVAPAPVAPPEPTGPEPTASYPAYPTTPPAAPAWARATEDAPGDPTAIESPAADAAPTDATPVEPSPVGSTPVETTAAEGPQWDPQRNAYIQYDQARQAWLVFDDAAQEWKPLT